MKPPCDAPDEAAVVAELDEPLVLLEAVALGAGDGEDPIVDDAEGAGGAGVAGAVGVGCIAEEPVVAEPEALAAGRSVAPDGEGVV